MSYLVPPTYNPAQQPVMPESAAKYAERELRRLADIVRQQNDCIKELQAEIDTLKARLAAAGIA